MNNVSPVFKWHIQCYHYQNENTKNSNITIKTHEATMNYKYKTCTDISDDFELFVDTNDIDDINNHVDQTIVIKSSNKENIDINIDKKGNKHKIKNPIASLSLSPKRSLSYNHPSDDDIELENKLIKLTLKKSFEFANIETKKDFLVKRQEFRKLNKKDKHQEFEQELKLEGFEPKILARCKDSQNIEKSVLLSHIFFFFVSCFGCSPCYRTWLSNKCVKRMVHIKKEISI